jgi:hypothetical protein
LAIKEFVERSARLGKTLPGVPVREAEVVVPVT